MSSVITYDNTRYIKIEKFLSTRFLELDYIQSYFPCAVANPDDVRLNKWTTVKLPSRLIDVSSNSPDNLEGTIESTMGVNKNVAFHIKCTPILEPLCICQKDYMDFGEHHWLASNKQRISNSINKINSANNTAYTDATCSILLGMLRERNLTLHFGKVYGIYSGIISDHKEDITESYSSIKHKKWLKKFDLQKVYEKKKEHAKDTFNELCECDLDQYAVDMDIGVKKDDDDDDDDAKYILTHPKVPVQVVLMEKCDETLDNLVKELIERVRLNTRFAKVYGIRQRIFANKLRAWLFQVCAALTVANKEFGFVHNDLHVQNIMGRKTDDEYLYYKQGSKTFKVPTYGYVMQIIDYGRSTYEVDNVVYFGDVFDEDGDAGGQYTLPFEEKYGTRKSVNPNPAFDLARLACSFVEDLDDNLWPTIEHLKEHDIGELLYSWTFDDRENYMLDIAGFELYVHIAKCFRKEKPYKQITKKAFETFLTANEISGQTVYMLD